MSWYKDWFNKDYLRVYTHRDDREAAAEAQFVLTALGSIPRSVVDVGCGTGRHLQQLAGAVPRAVGVDLSAELLEQAYRRVYSGENDLLLVRADMRQLPFGDGSFALLTSFFTGFGYFDTDRENEAVAEEWSRVVEPGGHVFVDYLNALPVMQTAASITERDLLTDTGLPVRVREERALSEDKTRIVKRISLESSEGTKHYLESVRLYERDELIALFERAGLRVRSVFGDLAGSEWSATARRTALLLERPR